MTRAQVEFAKLKSKGFLGRRSDAHWNRATRTHDCCGSRTVWRHKFTCPHASGDGRLPPE